MNLHESNLVTVYPDLVLARQHWTFLALVIASKFEFPKLQ